MKFVLAYFIGVLIGVAGTDIAVELVENINPTKLVESTKHTETTEKPVLRVTVDRLEDNDYVVTEVCYGDYHKIIDIKQDEFNIYKKESDIIDAVAIAGKFHGGEDFSTTETYYQFKSNDNTVCWTLTREDIGFVPEENIEYTLIYFDNDTTEENKNCGCEQECECQIYDDIFLGVAKRQEVVL